MSSGRKPYLYFITAKHLYSIDIEVGEILESIELPTESGTASYTKMYLDHETCTIAVSSVKNKTSDVLMAFALFSYNPLRFNLLLQVVV